MEVSKDTFKWWGGESPHTEGGTHTAGAMAAQHYHEAGVIREGSRRR